ncbi:MAG: 3'-5' exonuclease [Neisseria sp.]|nr:3'-5' exonuclease [Neisseria sp.]
MNITTSSLLANLNPEQLRAVTYPAESALVLAGAGSGKTRVLTTRIAWLLATRQATVHSVLAVTFTNKAAKEMAARLATMTQITVRAMWLGTFHGLCHRFLRLHHRDAGLPASFQILDASDQHGLIKRLLKQWNISDSEIMPRSLQGFINAQKEAGLRAGALSAPDAYTQRLIECYAEYDAVCRREGLVDFAELMLRSYEVLHSNELLRAHYQKRFSHILVDEFQDTNKLQYAWLKLLAGGGAVMFAVGDDDQSIYRFRGANVGNMDALMRDFAVGEPIKLEQNYRSVGHILAAANAVIANNQKRLGKNLRTEAEDGEKIRFLHAIDDAAEAQYIVDEVRSLLREGYAARDIALLYRSNAQSRVLEQELFAARLPYRIYGGLRFYERQEIKHALAYLRLAVNSGDDNALLRIINMPPRGIGARTVENLQAAAQESRVSLFQAACTLAEKSPKIAVFVRLIHDLRARIMQDALPEIMNAAVQDSGLLEHYRTQKGEHQERIENLQELINAAAAFKPHESTFETLPENTADTPEFPLLAFLSNAALEAGEHQAGHNEDAVQLMTIHAAKGLEFDAVFLSGIEEGLFPSEYALNEAGGLEEERRLMYVAITRARQRLYLSAAQQRFLHGQRHYPLPSRFVDEIPEELLHLLSGSLNTVAPAEPTRTRRVETLNTARDFAGFAIGDNVRHAKFGTGVIVDALSKGDSARLTVNFGREGMKELDTAYAKLEKL